MKSFKRHLYKTTVGVTGGGLQEPTLGNIPLWYSPSTPCPDQTPVTYYIEEDINDWLTTTVLYTDAAGTIFAPAGHYTPAVVVSGQEISRQWDGNSFVGDTVCQ